MRECDTWKVRHGNDIIGQILTFEKNMERTKIVSKTLDGISHIQTIGVPMDVASVKIFCDRDERDRLNEYEATGASLSMVYRNIHYEGYIEDIPSWETIYPGQWYAATVNFIIDDFYSV